MKKIIALFVLLFALLCCKDVGASTGATGGYKVNSPFNLSYRQSSYVSSTGYLYAAGINEKCEFGNNSTSKVTTHMKLYKNGDVNDPFINPLDWSFTWYHTIVIDEDGQAWQTGRNFQGVFGQGASSVSSGVTSYKFIEVPIIGTDDYKAVSTDSGYYHSVVLLDDNTIWCAGQGSSFGKSGNVLTYEQLIMPEGKENTQIKDFAGGYTATWVLFEDGELWTTDTISNPWVKVADNVNFFDVDGSASYVYAVTNDNKILYGDETKTDSLVEIAPTLNGESFVVTEEVVQIRGGGYSSGASWGFLTKEGNLYTAAENSSGNGDLSKIEAYNVRYFDMGSSKDTSVTIYGYLDQYAQMYLWGDNGNGQLATGGTNDLSDPSHSESSVIIPSLDADFSGLYSIAPLIKKSTTDEILPADALYMEWSDEGFLYVDYSNFEWSDLEQKIEVTISDTQGVVTTFELDKNNQYCKDASYPTKFGLYTIQSQLLTKENGVWELDGSVNTTIFEIKLNTSIEFENNDENILNDLSLIVSYDDCGNLYQQLYSCISNSIDKEDIRFNEDLYTFYDKYEKYNLSASDFNIVFYSDNSIVTNITSSGIYKVELTFKGIEGYYEERVVSITFTIQQKTNILSNEIVFDNKTNEINFYNEGNDYFILINNELFKDSKYSVSIKIMGDNFYKEFDYTTENILLNMPKLVGDYTISVILKEETVNGIITYKEVTNTVTIHKSLASIESSNDEIKESIESIGLKNGFDCISDITSLLNTDITFNYDIYGVINDEFVKTDLSKVLNYTFYNNEGKITKITSSGEYTVVIAFIENGNYISPSNLSITFTIIQRLFISEDDIIFSNNYKQITFDNTEYSIEIKNGDTFLTGYTIYIKITDDNGFNTGYFYGNSTWELMPKKEGVYQVEICLYDYTVAGKDYTSYTTTTLEVKPQNNSIITNNSLTNLLNSFETKDTDITDEILNSITIEYISLRKDYYVITRENGKDYVSVLEDNIENYELTINEIVDKSGTYTLTIKLNNSDIEKTVEFTVAKTGLNSLILLIPMLIIVVGVVVFKKIRQ